jgi:hypothetical protein
MRYIIITALAAFAYLSCHAQQTFQEVLQKTFIAFDSTQDYQKKVDQSNRFGMIAKKWDSEWSTHYYNAYSKGVLSYMEKDEAKRDAYLDEADRELDEAISLLGKENDETWVLKGMLANARMVVKPQARWQKYGKLFDEDLDKAKELNADNPRIYYLRGTSKFFTPKMFGGGKKAALPFFEKADGLFAKESGDDITKPYWGKTNNNFFLSQSKGEDNDQGKGSKE